jgi:hypothetical protein
MVRDRGSKGMDRCPLIHPLNPSVVDCIIMCMTIRTCIVQIEHVVVKNKCMGTYAWHCLMSFGEWKVFVGRDKNE